MRLLRKNDESASVQVKASTAYTICNVIQRSLSFITLPVFSRLLTTDEYGLSTVYSSTMAILIIFTSLQLPYGTFTTAMVKFEDDRRGYVSAVNGLCTLLMLVYFAIYIPLHSYWDKLLDLPEFLMIIMGFEMLASTSLNFWMSLQRFEYRYKQVVFVTLLSSFASTAVAIIAVVSTDSNRGVVKLLAYSLTAIAIGLFFYVQSFALGKRFYDKQYWHYALSFNLPLIPYYVSQMIFNQSDRLMINSMCGRSDAAKYGVAYSLAIILNFVLNAINDSYTPWLYRKIKEKDFATNKKVALAIAGLMAFLLLGVITLAPEIIYVLAGSKYADAVWVVPPVAMSLLFLFYTQLFANIEFYYEEKYYLVGGSILSAVTNIVLNWIFIKIFGYVAAAYTTLFSFILFALCNYFCMIAVCKKHDLDWHIYNVKALVLLSIVFMAAGFVMMAFYNLLAVRILIVLIVLAIVFVKRKPIIAKAKGYIGLFK